MSSTATSQTPTSATPDAPKLIKKAGTSDAKSPVTPTQTTFGCQHLKSLLTIARQHAVDGYTKLIATLQKEDNISHRICKGTNGCFVTGQTTYLCLQCPNVSVAREKHRKDHGFAVESANGFIMCFDCKDFVYDPTFEEIRTASTTKKRKHTASAQEGDKKLVATNSTAAPCAARGLRGFYNMGQTCFMSVILQSLIHNPFIRAYYLAEGHQSSECEQDPCTSCALDEMFTEFYGTEKREGYGAVQMLWGCWKGSRSLAGYSQQDAHEFLGSILNSLHEANTDEEETTKDNKNCDCVVHKTFSGLMRSTVTCETCKNSNSTLEAFMDLSLDVKSAGFITKKKKLTLTNGVKTIQEAIPVNLFECLDRFTSLETLSSDSYHCPKCDAARDAKKRLSLMRLPLVLPIHFKRFSHSKSNSQSSKVETRVRFPFTLDLSAYASVTDVAHGQAPALKAADEDGDTIEVKTPSKKGGDEGFGEPQQPVYELSSVVVHKGTIDNGHYISYSKQEGHWFRFDDSMVVQVHEKEVLNAEAYMLFYVIREI